MVCGPELNELLSNVVSELLVRFERLETLEAEVAKLREESSGLKRLFVDLQSALVKRPEAVPASDSSGGSTSRPDSASHTGSRG